MTEIDTANDNLSCTELENPEFWRTFLAEQIGRLVQMFRNHGLHAALAEELTQATVLDAIRGRNSYDPARGTLQQWLFGIANNTLALEMRRRQYQPKFNSDLLDHLQKLDSQPLPDEILERQETADCVRKAMDSLAPQERDVLAAKYQQDLSVRQISMQMNLTEKAVESLLYRARINLRTLLQKANPLTREC